MTTKIYLGGPSAYADSISELASKVNTFGLEVTHRWWQEVLEAESSGVAPNDPALPMMVALNCLAGVGAADVFVGVIASKGVGVWVELGYAIALGKPVLLLATEHAVPSVFTKMADQVLDIGDSAKPSLIAQVVRRINAQKARA